MRQQLNHIVQCTQFWEFEKLAQEFEVFHAEDLSSEEISEDEFTARYQTPIEFEMLTDARMKI